MNETFNYLRANGIYSLEDLEHRVSEHSAATESLKKTLDEQTARMKAIKRLYDSSAAFQSLKPVYDGLQKIKFMAVFSPLPFALLGFDETKNYGVSFCKNFLATCLAGVIILFAMGLFPNLLSGFSGGEISGFKGDMWSSVCASVALMLIVIKSGTIARDVFGG